MRTLEEAEIAMIRAALDAEVGGRGLHEAGTGDRHRRQTPDEDPEPPSGADLAAIDAAGVRPVDAGQLPMFNLD